MNEPRSVAHALDKPMNDDDMTAPVAAPRRARAQTLEAATPAPGRAREQTSEAVTPAPGRARDRVLQHETLNFWLTNRIPRVLATRLMGRLSRIESPWLTKLLVAVWRQFTALDLGEAKQPHFASLRECFIRELKSGARPIDADPAVLTSPCDAIVGACGSLRGVELLQAKGMPYALADLLGSAAEAERYRDGSYVTLRLTSAMYHRFHAPADGRVEHVSYLAGDVWNVNPVALKRVPRLFCRNERAAIRFRLRSSGQLLTLVPVAAVLVASIRLHWLAELLHLRYDGPRHIECDAPFAKGQEMGWFEHGSTIIVFAPAGFTLLEGIVPGQRLRMGQPLLGLPGE